MTKFNDDDLFEKIFKHMAIIWCVFVLFDFAVFGVLIWAAIKLVNHFT